MKISVLSHWAQLKLRLDRRAVTAVEYALIAGFLSILIVTGVSLIGVNLSNTFGYIGNHL